MGDFIRSGVSEVQAQEESAAEDLFTERRTKPRRRYRREIKRIANDADILVGAMVIENALLARLCAIGIPVSLNDMEWNGGRGLLTGPEYLQLKIKAAGGSSVMRVFRREDLAHAAREIGWHVQHQINQIATQCFGLLRAHGR